VSPAHHDIGRDATSAVVKAIPPVAVWSFTLNDWLAAVSILYVLLQVAHLIWKWRREGQARGRP
jgi:hypothetical protein